MPVADLSHPAPGRPPRSRRAPALARLHHGPGPRRRLRDARRASAWDGTGCSHSRGFASLVDQYLDRFGHFHPSIAAGNGLHGHDGELEDFSAASVAAEIKWLHSAREQFAALDANTLTRG